MGSVTPALLLYRLLVKRAKIYGDLVEHRQLGSAKELYALCCRIGPNKSVSAMIPRTEVKMNSSFIKEQIRKQYRSRVGEKDSKNTQTAISNGFTLLRAINERLNFLCLLPASTISSTTTHYANIQIESFSASTSQNKRPKLTSFGRDSNRGYTFVYKVTISHIGQQDSPPFRLKSRRWVITNEDDHVDVIEGEGVVGKQPRLCAGENFTYTSFCTLSTPLGVMKGHFVLFDEVKGHLFDAVISPIRLDVRQIPTKEQAEDIEAATQSHTIPVYYNRSSASGPLTSSKE